jgi:hypothetical protein
MVKFYFEENGEDEDDFSSVSMTKGFKGSTHFDEYSEMFLEFMKAVGYSSAEHCEVIKSEVLDSLEKEIQSKNKEISSLKSELLNIAESTEDDEYSYIDEEEEEEPIIDEFIQVEDENPDNHEYDYIEDEDEEQLVEQIKSNITNFEISEDIEEHNDYDDLDEEMVGNFT